MTWFTDFPQNVPFPVIVNVMFCGEFVVAVLKLTSVSDIPKTSLWSFGTEA